ncbi:ABC transporter ATP-binding protein [Virgibacillus ihumii]|uniref:ABC transporter ATP-binding protein n=1 Tax=Virgibacillus ihumii TaxID=2686091 RepID=UPI00157E0F2C|nr:ABC transporter ATP-binding protein [Virgibacillus ihumii]
MALLTVNELTKEYDNKLAVNHINFQFDPGKCVALIGPNGAGKTTTLRMLSGLIKPTNGNVLFEGMGQHDDLRKFIGYLPQYPIFHTWMTGREFLVYVGRLAYMSKKEASKRADELLQLVGLEDSVSKRIGKYSGGMKQRLGIAQAIIHNPRLLMLDEPVASLDPIGRRDVLGLLETLKQKMTILFSTHILSDADEISDELLLLHEGRIVESGSIKELREKYQTSEIELAFQDDPTAYQSALENLPSIETCYMNKNMLYVTAGDMQQARKEILSSAAQKDWPLTSYSIKRTSLEDLFMKAVNN